MFVINVLVYKNFDILTFTLCYWCKKFLLIFLNFVSLFKSCCLFFFFFFFYNLSLYFWGNYIIWVVSDHIDKKILSLEVFPPELLLLGPPRIEHLSTTFSSSRMFKVLVECDQRHVTKNYPVSEKHTVNMLVLYLSLLCFNTCHT